ncbi:MAG: Ig-like domain-containing protein [Thermoplasmatota archaeon]
MRIKEFLPVLLMAGVLLMVLAPQPANAHAPASVTVSYNFSTQNLTVTISHSVSNPNTHYIQTVTVFRNSNQVNSYSYTSQPTSNTFSYTYSVTASDGDTLSARADCNLGGSGTGSATASAPDTTPPAVQITSPSNNSEVTTSAITVSGTASDNKELSKVQVKVNDGQWGDATGKASWTRQVTLAEGSNIIHARAIDASDNEAEASINVVYNATPPPDTTPPTVVIQSPTDGSELAVDTVTVSGTASDNEDVARVELRVGTGSWVQASGTISWSASVNLAHGTNTVEARATDTNDNTGTDNITLVFDPLLAPDTTPPVLTIDLPVDGFISPTEIITVSGTASDDRSLDKVEGRVNGGSWNTAAGTSSWSVQLSLIEGSNTIEVRAMDSSGNTDIDEITVTHDPGEPPDTVPPLIEITSPADGSELSEPVITVSGTGSDSSCLCRVEVSLNGGNWQMASGRLSWSIELELTPGYNLIEVRGFDDSGNMGTDSISVTYNDTLPDDNTHPVVAITEPSDGSTFTQPSITVRGTAEDDRSLYLVEVKLNDGSWRLAPGLTSWSIDLVLEEGENTITARAIDGSDNEMQIAITVTYEPAYTPGSLDGIVQEGEYRGVIAFDDGDLTVYYDFEDEMVKMAVKARAEGWISLGFDPSVAMKDADMVIGWVDDRDRVYIFDAYSTGEFGPHPPDEELGGSGDIVDFGGTESGGWTTIEWTRKANSSDLYDTNIFEGAVMDVIWAYSDADDFDSEHTNRGGGEIAFTFGSIPLDDDDADDDAADDDDKDEGGMGALALVGIFLAVMVVAVGTVIIVVMVGRKMKKEGTEEEEPSEEDKTG